MALLAPSAKLLVNASLARGRHGRRASVRVRAADKESSSSPSAPPPAFQRTVAQQQLADLDKSLSDAQAALGESLLSSLGPLRGMLGLNPSTKTKIASGQSPRWAAAAEVLNKARLKSVTAAQAQELVSRGWLILDVGPKEDYDDFHASGSVNAPSVCYAASGGSDLRGLLRQAALASLQVRNVEEDPDGFLGAALEALGGQAAGVIVACAAGGTLRPTTNFPAGQASRSLFAAELLLTKAGLDPQRVVHLRGGLSAWFRDGLAGEGMGEWDARKGRAPSVEGPTWAQDAPELM